MWRRWAAAVPPGAPHAPAFARPSAGGQAQGWRAAVSLCLGVEPQPGNRDEPAMLARPTPAVTNQSKSSGIICLATRHGGVLHATPQAERRCLGRRSRGNARGTPGIDEVAYRVVTAASTTEPARRWRGIRPRSCCGCCASTPPPMCWRPVQQSTDRARLAIACTRMRPPRPLLTRPPAASSRQAQSWPAHCCSDVDGRPVSATRWTGPLQRGSLTSSDCRRDRPPQAVYLCSSSERRRAGGMGYRFWPATS